MTLQRPKVQQVAGRVDDPAGVALSAEVMAAQARLMELRRAAGIADRPNSRAWLARLPGLDQLDAAESGTCESGTTSRVENDPAGDVGTQTLDQGGALAGAEVTVYPRLAAAILQAGQARAARLWLVLLASDPARRGVYDLDRIYETFAGQGSPWRIGGRRTVQQSLKAGAGIFWTRDDRGRLWRHGPAKVGAALGLAGGVGAPVLIPAADLLGGMRSVRAALFSAALTAHDDPISQELLEELTGACPNTQRAYRQTAGVEARPQIRFLPGTADRAGLQDAHWQHGAPVFVFVDHDGRQGRGAGAYILAKLDPNAYTAALKPAQRGRTKKINKRLNLVLYGARGNGPAVDYERFYFQTAAAGGSAYNRQQGRRDCAYKLDQGGRVDFWDTIPALSGAQV